MFIKKTLYSASSTLTDENIMEKLSNFNFNKLTDEEAEQLKGEIKYSEVLTSLKNMNNDKSPGSDDFTAEFFNFFWMDIGNFIVR